MEYMQQSGMSHYNFTPHQFAGFLCGYYGPDVVTFLQSLLVQSPIYNLVILLCYMWTLITFFINFIFYCSLWSYFLFILLNSMAGGLWVHVFHPLFVLFWTKWFATLKVTLLPLFGTPCQGSLFFVFCLVLWYFCPKVGGYAPSVCTAMSFKHFFYVILCTIIKLYMLLPL